MGKGSRPRPVEIPTKQFNDNWDRIFGKKDEKKPSDNHDSKKNK